MAKRKIQGVTVQLISKANGQAIDRQWFKHVEDVKVWLDGMYPNWEKDYDIEMFSD